jgi:glycosyltransferase involved in cell wall biosynthesis
MERVLTTKVNYLADVLGYDITLILTDGDDQQPAFALSPKIKIVQLGIHFEDLWRLSFLKKIPVYLKKQRIYRRLLSQTLLELKPDVTVSLLRREINFLASIPDGSMKVGELHFCRKHYRNFEKGDTNPVKRLFANWWMRQLVRQLKRLDRFVVLTEEDKEAWVELSNVTVIPNPTPIAPFIEEEHRHKHVIAAGRFVYQKGFDLLTEAWSKICQRFPDWELYVYGRGDKTEYEALARQLNANHIHFEDATPQLMERFRTSSIFVLSSRFEGLPMVVLEAMNYGMAVAAFACACGPKDIITPGVNGLLAEDGNVDDLADKLAQLMADEAFRTRLGKQAATDVHQYEVPPIMARWDRLFHELMLNYKQKGGRA